MGLDSSIFIYQIDDNPTYSSLTQSIFVWLQSPQHTGVTSSITWTEILVPAYRASDWRRIDRYIGLFATYPHLDWVAPDLTIADLAARIRAQHRLKTPDAIQAATAMASGATLFVTNDRAFRKVPGFESLLLDELL